MSKKVRVFLVLTILVVALVVSSTILGNFASNSDNIAEGAGFHGANEAGMAIYQQSERAGYRRIPARIIEEGMAIYQESERNAASVRSNAKGLAIYHRSERFTAIAKPAVPNEVGLAIYHASEHESIPIQTMGATQEGMAIYRASERNNYAPAVRLYDGKPFNAYQRSEWLGAER